MLKSILAIIVLSGLMFSCGDLGKSTSVLDFEVRHLEYQSANCEPERDACLMADIDYPEFTEGDSLARFLANRIIRNSTLDFLGMGDIEAAISPEIEVALVDLDSSFQKLKREAGTAAGWQAKLTTKELYRNDSIVVLEIRSMAYFGGAHPQYNVRYFNFNRLSGSLIPLSGLVDVGRFTLKAEEQFKNKFLKEGQSYREAGFDFFKEKFVLAANYAFRGDSILLHYNHYEIAPYAAGQIYVAVPLN